MSKKLSVFARLMILVMCLALVFCGCKKSEDAPGADDAKDKANSAVGDAFDKTLGGLLGGGNGVIDDVLACGKVTVSVGSQFENVLYIDSNAGTFADMLKINADGQNVTVNLYGNNGEIAVQVPSVLGDQAYGLNLNTLMEDLKNSPILAMTGMSFEDLEKQLGVDFEGVLDTYAGMFETMSSSAEAIMDKIFAHVDVKTTEGKVTINGTEVDATIITYSFDENDVKNIIFELIDWAEKTVKDMASDLSDKLGSMMGESVDVETLLKQMNMDQVKERVSAVLAGIDMNFTLAMNINASNGMLMSVNAEMNATVNGMAGKIYADLILGVDPTASNKYTLDIGGCAADGSNKAGFLATLERDMDQAVQVTALKVEQYMGTQSRVLLEGSLTYDTTSNKFVLAGNAGGSELRVDGMYKETESSMEFGIDSVTMNGNTVAVDLMVKFEALNGAEMPKMPSYKNPLKMNMAELMELLQGLGFGMTNEPEISNPNYGMEDILGGMGGMEDILGGMGDLEDIYDIYG